MATTSKPLPLPHHDDATRRAVGAPAYLAQLQKFLVGALVTLFTALVLMVWLVPFASMVLTSLKSRDQIVASATGPVLPLLPAKFSWDGQTYDVYRVPTDDGIREWALVRRGREDSAFLDPENPEAGLIEWAGRWRTLNPVFELAPQWGNYAEAWNTVAFPRLFSNTFIIAFTGMVGTLLSSIAVAYGFARFPIPGKNVLFIILLATILLPGQVTLIPTYAVFARIGWTGTWLPLIVPHFFANAYNVFLLRQFFLTLPRELDEAAMIDGAGPLQTLLRVIVPQSWAAILAVALFHIVFAWNDYFNPLIYLLGKPELQPISVGIQIFNQRFSTRPELVQATSLLALALPVVLFFIAQRAFMRGVVITGVEK